MLSFFRSLQLVHRSDVSSIIFAFFCGMSESSVVGTETSINLWEMTILGSWFRRLWRKCPLFGKAKLFRPLTNRQTEKVFSKKNVNLV